MAGFYDVRQLLMLDNGFSCPVCSARFAMYQVNAVWPVLGVDADDIIRLFLDKYLTAQGVGNFQKIHFFSPNKELVCCRIWENDHGIQ